MATNRTYNLNQLEAQLDKKKVFYWCWDPFSTWNRCVRAASMNGAVRARCLVPNRAGGKEVMQETISVFKDPPVQVWVIPQHQAQWQTHTLPVRAGYPQKHSAPLKVLQAAGDSSTLQMLHPAVQPLAEDGIPEVQISAARTKFKRGETEGNLWKRATRQRTKQKRDYFSVIQKKASDSYQCFLALTSSLIYTYGWPWMHPHTMFMTKTLGRK